MTVALCFAPAWCQCWAGIQRGCPCAACLRRLTLERFRVGTDVLERTVLYAHAMRHDREVQSRQRRARAEQHTEQPREQQ